MSNKRPPSTRRAPSQGKLFLRIAGLWMGMIAASFAIGFYIISPLINYANRAEASPRQPSPERQASVTTPQVQERVIPDRPGPSVDITPDTSVPKDEVPSSQSSTPLDGNGLSVESNPGSAVQQPDTMDEERTTRSRPREEEAGSNDSRSETEEPRSTQRRRTDDEGTPRAAPETTPTRPSEERRSARRQAASSSEGSGRRSRRQQPVQQADKID